MIRQTALRSAPLAALLLLLSSIGCARVPKTKLQEDARSIIGVLPEKMPGGSTRPALVRLGRALFLEKRLSANNTVSCNNCHNILKGGSGSDNLRVSVGIRGQQGDRNAPTVLNAGFHFAQFWDGRAATLEEQAKGPIVNPVEMGMPSPAAAVSRIAALPEYGPKFAAAFRGDRTVTFNRIAEAIAAFERTLITRDRFDRFQNGDLDALSAEETKGLELFLKTGCISCHSGENLGGRFYRKIGIVRPYSNTKDLGRFALTGQASDRYLFKVPSLRNVARTAPYFHDGGAPTLEDAVSQMASLQLGRTLSDYEIYYMVKFLGTLSGELAEEVKEE